MFEGCRSGLRDSQDWLQGGQNCEGCGICGAVARGCCEVYYGVKVGGRLGTCRDVTGLSP